MNYSISALFTIAMGWIALAGLADNLVTWKTWFEVGVMEHWRAIKEIAGFAIFDLIDRKTPDLFFEKTVAGLTILRALHQVDKRRSLNGALFFPSIGMVIFMVVVNTIGSYVSVFMSREWLNEYFYTVPILHFHRGFFIGAVLVLFLGIAGYFISNFIFGLSIEEYKNWDNDSDDPDAEPTFAIYFADILLWLVTCSANYTSRIRCSE